MPLKESEAIILRSFPLGEGDRLVSFLDRQSGRMRGVARGARLPKSRFGSTLELLSYVRIWYFERETRDLVRINQCELLESFLEVQRDYRAGIILALVSEVTEAVLEEREAADAQFRLILVISRAIKRHGASQVILAYFSLWTVRLGGWLGSLDACAQCGISLAVEPGYASSSSLGILCARCRQGSMRTVTAEALLVGRLILSGTLDHTLKEKPSDRAAAEIAGYALNIIEHHIERELTTRHMLNSEEKRKVET
jgi:DNA repair protein RecO (recombination protein O)